ncbi:alpha/beta hydrolase [uncultured Paraglaciecola sp.]|uniref:alpha/beta fold hydrolase n=1 Tax=uncultured Paraglaciecola sp. TaxID=1765024 RepID=UPI002592E82B|nr:alpha/beta hydrolase [uncultured Paraglaciecola sp.]
MQQALEFSLNNLTIRGIGYGDPNKQQILALHGWLDNAASFEPLSKYLNDYYIVAIDLAGHGLSDHRDAGAHYHLIDFVYDLQELVESQGWTSLVLMGHSMGGIIGSLYSACFGERVKKYISIESFGPLTKEAHTSPSQLRDSIISRLKAQKSKSRHPTNFERTVEARTMVGDITSDSARLLVARNTREISGQLRFTTDRRLRTLSPMRLTAPQAESFLRNIQCPVLAVMGNAGYQSMAEAFHTRKDWVADLEFHILDGHHHLHMDSPKVVADVIDSFIKS